MLLVFLLFFFRPPARGANERGIGHPAATEGNTNTLSRARLSSARYKFLASVRNDTSLAESLGESQLQEGMDMLNHILATRVKLLGEVCVCVCVQY